MELKKKGNKGSVMGEAVSRGNKMEVQLFIKVSIAAYSVHGIVNKRTFTLNLFVLQHAYYNARFPVQTKYFLITSRKVARFFHELLHSHSSIFNPCLFSIDRSIRSVRRAKCFGIMRGIQGGNSRLPYQSFTRYSCVKRGKFKRGREEFYIFVRLRKLKYSR